MNTLERFHAIMNFEPVDRPLYWEFGIWVGTLRRWYREGLPCVVGIPEELPDRGVVHAEYLGPSWRNPHYAHDVSRELGFDQPPQWVPINNYLCPTFEPQLLEDAEEWSLVVNSIGETVQTSKVNGTSRWIDAPVKTPEDYHRIREERMQPNLSERVPPDWAAQKERLKRRTFPLLYGGYQGLFNMPRRLLGFERLMVSFYEQPQLIKEMVKDLCDLLIALYDPVLTELGGDCGLLAEDMCYKAGCLISPAMFREFLMPGYKRLTGFFRDHGVRTVWVDSDGDVTNLIPLLIEGGVTGLAPFEVTGKCNVVDVRRGYPRFQILGGVDKKAVAAGKEAIDQELEGKVPFVFQRGGYIPFIDHNIPSDISWQNFEYYRRRLAELAVRC